MDLSTSNMPDRICWHVIASEYPPQQGGVSDYTHVVARALAAAGDEVHVWCPAVSDPTPALPGVIVHRELGRIGRSDLIRLDHLLEPFPAPRRLLLQWVPHGFGFNAMNLWICVWLRARARRWGDQVEIVVHEPFLRITGGSWRQAAAALVQRLMTVVLLGGARRVLVTIPEWERLWRPYAIGRRVPFRHAPVPSTVAIVQDASRVDRVRAAYAEEGAPLVGHFGTHGSAGTALATRTLSAILDARPDVHLVLLGRGGHELRQSLVNADPARAARIHATGVVAAAELSLHLSACDVMVQPFPNGVNGRHTSIMASLAHGRAVVTTGGAFTEPYWIESDAVRLARADDARDAARLALALLAQPAERERLGRAARALYDARFDVAHVVTALHASE
jgi:glycosyltransferase involved in cell wall biosynthesis